MRQFPNFKIAIANAFEDMRQYGASVHPANWQGVDVSNKPEAEMRELTFYEFQVPIGGVHLERLQDGIKPNLPWADDHFLERVSGQPLNPGEQWKHWPWSLSADNHRDKNGQFNHTYMERYWPKNAGLEAGDGTLKYGGLAHPNTGIRYAYGDLNDIVRMLKKDPLTRQAYLPIFFPEDLSHNDRKPCSLGYHFLMRNDRLNVSYYIRSCDMTRHFRDDIYLTVRLLIWVLEQCGWANVTPGLFRMDIGSLHMFRNDFAKAFGK